MTWVAPLTGRDLSNFVQSAEFTRLSNDHIAPTPGLALRRIEERLGAKPTAGGQNVAEIVEFRDILASEAKSTAVLNALMITAPHTHWDTGLPVIVRRNDDGYTIGLEEPPEFETFVPVSFAMAPSGPFPYEWASEFVGLRPVELKKTWALVGKACAVVGKKNWPLGLSLAFRFKSLFEPFSIPAVEYTPEGDEDHHSTQSIILRKNDLEAIEPGVSYAQVGWHAFSDTVAELSEVGKAALQELRELALAMAPDQRREFAKRLNTRSSHST